MPVNDKEDEKYLPNVYNLSNVLFYTPKIVKSTIVRILPTKPRNDFNSLSFFFSIISVTDMGEKADHHGEKD